MEADEQRQIDRACSAQSPDMLPSKGVKTSDLEAAKARVEEQKAQYDKPVNTFRK